MSKARRWYNINFIKLYVVAKSAKTMNPKHALQFIVHFVMVVAGLVPAVIFAQGTARPRLVIEERLPVPFGTVVKMKVIIVDGEELNDKGHQSSFLLKVMSVDGITLSKPVIIEFEDETGKFPNGVFELYKYLKGKEAHSISSEESDKIKKKYVGKEFDIAGYETGKFTGIPRGYGKYQPERQDYGFHFRHYIIVIADLASDWPH